jgi:hypothetical protein
MQLNGWDRALKISADGKGLAGHAGAILLPKAADQAGLTSGLSAALVKKGTSPLLDRGLVLAANIAADLAAWTRLLGHHDEEELRDANPDTLRYRVWHLPARLTRHARHKTLAISAGWPWANAFLTCWQRLCTLPALT